MTTLLPALAVRSLRENRRAAIGWAIGLAAVVFVYVGAYGQLDAAAAAKEQLLPEAMQKIFGMTDLTTGAGYLETTVYALVGPLLLIMCAVTLGTRTIAGPEGSGTIDLLLANPISRHQFVYQRVGAFLAYMVALGLLVWALVLVLATSQDMGVSPTNITAATLGLFLLALCFGFLAVATGAVTGSRATSLAVAGGAAVATYVMNALSRLVAGGEWLHWLSPFHYASGHAPLRNGFDLVNLLVLVGISLVCAVVSLVVFDRRDVAV
jgi:ABC-2 type transport system permease protein